jgi:hypothetical protein
MLGDEDMLELFPRLVGLTYHIPLPLGNDQKLLFQSCSVPLSDYPPHLQESFKVLEREIENFEKEKEFERERKSPTKSRTRRHSDSTNGFLDALVHDEYWLRRQPGLISRVDSFIRPDQG